jgi:hypothetical protein
LENAKSAFSWRKFREAIDERVRSNGAMVAFLYTHRVWLLAASGVTLFLPVMENDNTACLNWSQSPALTGFDVLVPVLTKVNLFSGAIASRTFSIDPLGLLIYLPLAVHLYFQFVKYTVPARWVFWQGVIQTSATILLPFTQIAILTWVLPGFHSVWHLQPPLWGFWILLGCGVALLLGAYGELLKVREAPASASLRENRA